MLQGDSVLVLNKPEAVVLSNSLSQKQEFMERLKNSLKREAQIMAIWENTQTELEEQRILTKNVKQQLLNTKNTLDLTEEQLQKTESISKKSNRKSLVTGFVVGLATGLVTGIVLSN